MSTFSPISLWSSKCVWECVCVLYGVNLCWHIHISVYSILCQCSVYTQAHAHTHPCTVRGQRTDGAKMDIAEWLWPSLSLSLMRGGSSNCIDGVSFVEIYRIQTPHDMTVLLRFTTSKPLMTWLFFLRRLTTSKPHMTRLSGWGDLPHPNPSWHDWLADEIYHIQTPHDMTD